MTNENTREEIGPSVIRFYDLLKKLVHVIFLNDELAFIYSQVYGRLNTDKTKYTSIIHDIPLAELNRCW